MTPLGQMFPKHEILSTNLYHYKSDFQKVVAVCEVLFVCFNVFFIYREYRKLKSNGRNRYFSETWTYMELLMILLSVVTIGLFTKRFISVSKTLKDHAENHNTQYIDFSEAFVWNSILEYVMAFLVAIAIIKATKLLNFINQMNLFNETVGNARGDLFGYFLLLSILMTAYSHCASLLFGRAMHVFRNIQNSFYHNTLIILGIDIAQELGYISPAFGPIYIISLVIAVQFILLKVCVTILETGFTITRFELSRKRQKQFLNYITERIKMVVARK